MGRGDGADQVGWKGVARVEASTWSELSAAILSFLPPVEAD